MRVSLKSVLAGVALSALSLSASAAVVTGLARQSGYGFGVSGTPPVFTGLQGGGIYPLTEAAGYNFSGENYAALTSVDKVTVTLTVNDGDSAAGEFDENDLNLYLDGIDTGLKLNGFPNDGILTLTLDVTTNPALGTSLLGALADGKLVGTVFDADSDGVSQTNPDFIGFPAGPDGAPIETSLTIEGQAGGVIPLPAAALMGPVGAGLVSFYSRRFRNKKK